MRKICEYLSKTPSSEKQLVKATDKTLSSIIYKEFDRVGPAADLNFIDVSEVTDMSNLFANTDFQGDVEKWNTSSVINMEGMFKGCKNFNSDMAKWDVRNVTSMKEMFSGCEKFNGDISDWEPKSLKYAEHMFFKCYEFNRNLNGWPIENCSDFDGMFYMCKKLSYGLSSWNLKQGANAYAMFYKCARLNFSMKNNGWKKWWDTVHDQQYNYMLTGAGFTKNNLPEEIAKAFKIKK